MPSSYPGALDALTNPTATDAMNSVTVPHATVHSLANDAIEAVQAELGVNPSGAAATVVARLDTLDTTVSGKAPATGIAPSAITGTAVVTADSRLSDARTPTAHAASHTDGGSDEITLAESQVTGLTSALAGKAATVALYLPGVAGNEVAAPHNAAAVGDTIDLRIDASLTNWNTGAFSGLFYKMGASTAAGDHSWGFALNTSNRISTTFSDGTNVVAPLFSVLNAAPFTTGGRIRLRVTYTRDTGAGQYAIAIYTNASDFTTPLDTLATWTQAGSTATGAAIGAMNTSSSPIRCGSRRTADAGPAGDYHAACVIVSGTTVAHWKGSVPASRFVDEDNNVWSVAGTANGWRIA